jgi:hypothetical protein
MAEDGKCQIKVLNVSHLEFRADNRTDRQTDRPDQHTQLSRYLNCLKPFLINEWLGEQNRKGLLAGTEICSFRRVVATPALGTRHSPIQAVTEGFSFRYKAAGA